MMCCLMVNGDFNDSIAIFSEQFVRNTESSPQNVQFERSKDSVVILFENI